MLLVPIHSNIDVDLESQAASLDHFVPPFCLTESGNGTNGFMVVSDVIETEAFSHKIRVSNYILIHLSLKHYHFIILGESRIV